MFSSTTHKSSLTFKVKEDSSINSLLKWIKDFVLTDDFDASVKASFTSSIRMRRLRKQVRDLIDALIYKTYPDPGGRTNALKNSFDVTPGTEDDQDAIGVTVFSDVSVATAKSGNSAGEFSYAAFFEKPVDFSSFIKAESPLDVKRYRPFMEQLSLLAQDINETHAAQAFSIAIKKRMPGIRG